MATADSEPAVNPNEDDVPREQQALIETLIDPFKAHYNLWYNSLN